jgi:hypothetical protein
MPKLPEHCDAVDLEPRDASPSMAGRDDSDESMGLEVCSRQKTAALALGSKVFLRGARHGEPGIVIRIRPEKVTVLWPAPDHIGSYPAVELVTTEK